MTWLHNGFSLPCRLGRKSTISSTLLGGFLLAAGPIKPTNSWIPTRTSFSVSRHRPSLSPSSSPRAVNYCSSQGESSPLSPSRIGTDSSTREEQKMTADALKIIREAIRAVNPYTAIQSCVKREGNILKVSDSSWDLAEYDEIVLVGFGKASSAMATAVLQRIYGDTNDDQGREEINAEKSTVRLPCSGVVICKDDHATAPELDVLKEHGVEVLDASHPVPDARSVHAADRLMQVVADRASPKTFLICCISGGGSALFCRPTPPLTLQDLQHVNSRLLASGMSIQEMNVLRKRLEVGKGGRLAAKCYPSQLLTLVLSDVVGDPLDLIASGPTVCDTSTWEEAWQIVGRYRLHDQLPGAVMDMLRQGRDGILEDSPSSDHPVFDTSRTVLVGNNRLAVEAAARTAQSLGYHPVILGTEIEGEAKEVAHVYTAMAKYLQQSYSQHHQQRQGLPLCFSVVPSLPAALIAGGETTVSLTPDSGKGGRNQELALAAALQLCSMKLRNVVLASAGTDGGDGPTDAAGAVVDATTVHSSLSGAIDALSTHNAYPYLDALRREGETELPLIKTGPTGTNVADICVTLVQPAPSSSSSSSSS